MTAVVTVIHCWSAPRSRSTALLYSFEARGQDCVAIDEPLYREWLQAKGDSVERPYSKAIIDGISPSGDDDDSFQWARELSSLKDRLKAGIDKLSGSGGGVIFCKHMAKHDFLYDFKEDLVSGENVVTRHVLLIRNPTSVLSSWNQSANVHGNSPSLEEVGIVHMMQIYSKLTSSSKQSVVILDSDDLASAPIETLTSLCHDVGIEYTGTMLTWKAGKHDCDGPWAKWWYESVHKSSGWVAQPSMSPAGKYYTLDPQLLPALRASLPAYEFLKTQTHGYKQRGPAPEKIYEDPRNEHVLVWIGAPGKGRLVPREMASISPWDSSVQGGDATWEGIRVYRGKVFKLERHLTRLFKSAKALGFDPANIHTREEITEAVFRTLAANSMRDGAHMRLTLTRGEKCTSSMNPNFNVYGTTLIILAEWKPTEGATTYDNSKGISLITASQRRNAPAMCDSKIHHNNMINNILPKMQANLAGAADAIMLDMDGFVSETNATNIFLVDDGILKTPHADYCLPGITRETIIKMASTELDVEVQVCRLSLAEFHAADEVFTTGTMGELTPVTTIDGRMIGTDGKRGPVTERLQVAFQKLPDRVGLATPIPEFVGYDN